MCMYSTYRILHQLRQIELFLPLSIDSFIIDLMLHVGKTNKEKKQIRSPRRALRLSENNYMLKGIWHDRWYFISTSASQHLPATNVFEQVLVWILSSFFCQVFLHNVMKLRPFTVSCIHYSLLPFNSRTTIKWDHNTRCLWHFVQILKNNYFNFTAPSMECNNPHQIIIIISFGINIQDLCLPYHLRTEPPLCFWDTQKWFRGGVIPQEICFFVNSNFQQKV